MGADEVDPIAVVQCEGCTWWWFFWEQRPTIPFFCDYCKAGNPPWEPRMMTPSYGTPKPRQPTIPFGLDEEDTRSRMRDPTPRPPTKKRRRKR